MEEWVVSANQLNSETAICKHALWIACGASGVIGICVLRRVAAACKGEPAQFWNLREMEESDAKETQWK